MDKNPARMLTILSDHRGSTAQESVLPAKNGWNQRSKRKASSEKMTARKKTRVPEVAEPYISSKEHGRVRAQERKVREDKEGPSPQKEKKGGLVRHLSDEEFLPLPVDTDSENSSNPSQGCSTSEGDVSNGSGKRKATAGGEGPPRKRKRSPELNKTKDDLTVDGRRVQFEAKYQEQDQLGAGGCGSVFAGYRKADDLPVAIKHIPQELVLCKHVDENGTQLSAEVAIMLKLAAGTNGSVGTSAAVSLLDWYDLDQELILVLERPVPSEDLLYYINNNGGFLQEEEAKSILKQLVEATIKLEDNCIFHRDIKCENILIENGSKVPRVRLIDFGLGCFTEKGSSYRVFYGTPTYIPPEWYNRDTYTAGPSTVWQLGIVLFEMVHKEMMFETTKYLVKKLTISSELSDDCQNFLQMCLAKYPEQRPSLKQLQLHPWLQ